MANRVITLIGRQSSGYGSRCESIFFDRVQTNYGIWEFHNSMMASNKNRITVEIDQCNNCPHFDMLAVQCSKNGYFFQTPLKSIIVEIPNWCPILVEQNEIGQKTEFDGIRDIDIDFEKGE